MQKTKAASENCAAFDSLQTKRSSAPFVTVEKSVTSVCLKTTFSGYVSETNLCKKLMRYQKTNLKISPKSDSQPLIRLKIALVAGALATFGCGVEARAGEAAFEIRFAANKQSFARGCVKTHDLIANARRRAFDSETSDNAEAQKTRRASNKNNGNQSPEKKQIESAAVDAQSKPKFHWKPALVESFKFLAIQHSYRMTQERTRRELGGAFFKDWLQSIKGLRGWQDSDGFFINYIAHPLQGGLTGRIFVNNSDAAKRAEFGKSREYWRSRFRAMLWSTAWSAQFELGPLSEASLGNVGIRKKRGRNTMAYIDLVVTPTLGTGVLIGEDAIDKFVLRKWLECKTDGRATTKIKILRSVLTPTTSFANILRGKMPWKRDNR